MPPWKCIMSLILVVLTSLQVWTLNRYIIPYTRASKQNWQVYLVEPDIYANPHGFGDDLSFRIYEISTLVSQVEYSIEQYYIVENKTVGNFIVRRYANGDILPPLLTVEIFVAGLNDGSGDIGKSNVKTQTYNLTVDNLGPFSEENDTELSEYVHSMRSFRIDFEVKNILDYGQSNGYDSCYMNWVSQKYSFSWRGRIDLTVNPSVRICDDQFKKKWYNRDVRTNIVLIMLILLVATISQILLIKSIWRQITLFQRGKKEIKVWNDLKWGEKREFFNLWFFISTTANVFNFIASGLCLNMFLGFEREDSTWKVPLAFVGLACAFSWFTLVQFFEHFPKYYSLILTLRMSAPKVMRFVFGSTPVFLGFAMFGVAMFSSYTVLFKDVGAASVTLFALLNGDVVHDIFNALAPAGQFVSQLYLYLFISTFIYAVLNIFIAIVEDSYFNARRDRKEKLAIAMAERSKNPEDLNVVNLLQGPPVPNHPHDQNPIRHSQHSDYKIDPYAQKQSGFLPKGRSETDLKEPLLKSFSFNSFNSPPPPNNRVPRKRAQKRRELLEVLGGVQNSEKDKFLYDIHSMIVSNSSVSIRPPHDPNYYPCDFDDCIYCILKQIYKNSLKEIAHSIQREVDRLRDMHLKDMQM